MEEKLKFKYPKKYKDQCYRLFQGSASLEALTESLEKNEVQPVRKLIEHELDLPRYHQNVTLFNLEMHKELLDVYSQWMHQFVVQYDKKPMTC